MSRTGLTQAAFKELVAYANALLAKMLKMVSFCDMKSVNSTFNRNSSTFGS